MSEFIQAELIRWAESLPETDGNRILLEGAAMIMDKQQKQVAKLSKAAEKLYMLEAYGVDNWEGYSDAMQELAKENSEDDDDE